MKMKEADIHRERATELQKDPKAPPRIGDSDITAEDLRQFPAVMDLLGVVKLLVEKRSKTCAQEGRGDAAEIFGKHAAELDALLREAKGEGRR
jgi:hypothetical protein